jgi:bacillithiol biosynthesis deacetylase BshB1
VSVDVLAIGAHPDDIELSCGGTIAKLVRQGYKVALADMTKGELGTRGSGEVRLREASKAAEILKAETRRNLGIPDGNILVNAENRTKLIQLIRELQPQILLIPVRYDRHPDHGHTHELCKEAWFYAGLAKIETMLNGTPQKAFRPDRYYEYMQWHESGFSFIVDVSDTFDTKMEAIRSYESQFYNPQSAEPETVLSQPDFLDMIEIRGRYYGRRIGVKYGEPFYSLFPLGIADLFDLVQWKK